MFIHMNTWIFGKDLMKHRCLIKKIFIAKKVFKGLKMNNLGGHHDLYVQSDTLLPADVFESFRNMSLKEYELDPAHFLYAPGLAWQPCLKRTVIKLELLTDNDMLLMIEKGIR